MTLYRDQITEKCISTEDNFCEQEMSENSQCTTWDKYHVPVFSMEHPSEIKRKKIM